MPDKNCLEPKCYLSVFPAINARTNDNETLSDDNKI